MSERCDASRYNAVGDRVRDHRTRGGKAGGGMGRRAIGHDRSALSGAFHLSSSHEIVWLGIGWSNVSPLPSFHQYCQRRPDAIEDTCPSAFLRRDARCRLIDGIVIGGQADFEDIIAFRIRSEERRVGKELVRTCRSGWWPVH